MYDLKVHRMKLKVLSAKFFLAHSFIKLFDKNLIVCEYNIFFSCLNEV